MAYLYRTSKSFFICWVNYFKRRNVAFFFCFSTFQLLHFHVVLVFFIIFEIVLKLDYNSDIQTAPYTKLFCPLYEIHQLFLHIRKTWLMYIFKRKLFLPLCFSYYLWHYISYLNFRVGLCKCYTVLIYQLKFSLSINKQNMVSLFIAIF